LEQRLKIRVVLYEAQSSLSTNSWHGRFTMPLLLWVLGVPGFIVILLWVTGVIGF